jgi:lauroyl/myristoyl acyltransferase
VASANEAGSTRGALGWLRARYGTPGEAAVSNVLATASRLPRQLGYRVARAVGLLRYLRQRRLMPVRPEIARLASDEAQLELWKRRQSEQRSYAGLELRRAIRAAGPPAGVIRIDGLGNLEGGLAEGAGAVLYTFHLAGLPTLFGGLARLGHPVAVIRAGEEGFADPFRLARARRQAPRLEEALGCRLIWMGRENFAAGAMAANALRRGEIVVAVVDLPVSRPAVEVELLGSRTVVSGGFAMLAEATGAPLLDVFCYRDRRPYPLRATIGAPLRASNGIASTVQACVTRLEEHLRRHPEAWVATPNAALMERAPALRAAA